MLFSALLATGLAILSTSQAAIDPVLAARYFQEAKWAADDDGGKLWGRRIDGPMLFVDPRSRTVVANHDAGGILSPQGNVFSGPLPPEVPVANTAVEWAGRTWSVVVWPLPTGRTERARLMAHELWHRVQTELGLPATMVRNAHLDTMGGRVWLQLEWRALSSALLAEGARQRPLIDHALLFRTYRRSMFPGAAAEEDRMEVHEGLAEYTGLMLRGTPEAETRHALAYRLKRAGDRASFPASFAYETGPAYGLLLDRQDQPWRSELKPLSSLSGLLASAVRYAAPKDLKSAAEQAARAYGGPELFVAEQKRERLRTETEAHYRRLLVDGPVLELPLQAMKFTYDPNGLFPLGSAGTVYPSTTVSDAWGTIRVEKGARITSDFKHLYVPLSSGAGALRGDGWSLQLSPGWRLVPGKRSGDWTVQPPG